MTSQKLCWGLGALLLICASCKEEIGGGNVPPPLSPSCTPAAKGSPLVAAPELLFVLADRFHEAFLASPAVADLDGDGAAEIIVPRSNKIIAWRTDGSIKWEFDAKVGRIWASPIVADFRDDPRVEVAFAARGEVFLLDADGQLLSGFPIAAFDELRGIGAGDIDADGQLELIASTTQGGPGDVLNAWNADGSEVDGFPPLAEGTSGCDERCFLAGAFDQNVAVGDLDGDGLDDIVVPHDNAFASFHKGTGEAFDANPIFPALKTPGVRYLHDLALAQQGFANDEETALQAHFTNTAPAIADIDGDDSYEILLLASVQNASQNNRELGVALWVLRPDASRLPGWEEPFYVPEFLSGLFDLGGNIVAATNQVTVADIDPARDGLEMIFAGFDGKIHAVGADKTGIFSVTYTNDPDVLTGGVAVADLSGDGVPEIVFNTYSTDEGKSALFVLDAGGGILHQVPLPGRGAMPVPTLADVDANGTLEIVVSLKDAEDQVQSVQVYGVPGSATNCLLWPTGRGNLLRNGFVP